MYGVTWPSFSAAATVFSHSTCHAALASAAKPAVPLNRRAQRQIVNRMVFHHCMRVPHATTRSLVSAALCHSRRWVALAKQTNHLIVLVIASDTDWVLAMLPR